MRTFKEIIKILMNKNMFWWIKDEEYVKIKYKEHNKDRFLNQYILLQDIESKLDEINEFVFKTIKELKSN